MSDQEILRQARQHFVDKLAEKAVELHPLIQRIRALDEDLNEQTDFMAILASGDTLGTPGTAAAGTATMVAGIPPKLRPDEFTGKTYFQAAKSYLERIGHAVSMQELLEVLKSGGSPVGGKTPKKTLYISLVRAREFYPIPGQKDYIGLRKWYKNLKGGADKKAGDKKRKK